MHGMGCKYFLFSAIFIVSVLCRCHSVLSSFAPLKLNHVKKNQFKEVNVDEVNFETEWENNLRKRKRADDEYYATYFRHVPAKDLQELRTETGAGYKQFAFERHCWKQQQRQRLNASNYDRAVATSDDMNQEADNEKAWKSSGNTAQAEDETSSSPRDEQRKTAITTTTTTLDDSLTLVKEKSIAMDHPVHMMEKSTCTIL